MRLIIEFWIPPCLLTLTESHSEMMSVRPLIPHHSIILSALLSISLPVLAQEPNDEAPVATATDSADSSSPFPVPEGDTEKLIGFLREVQMAQPPQEMRNQEGVRKFLRLQVEAVLKACDKIEEQKPSEEVKVRLIKERTMALQALSRIDQDAGKKLSEMIDGLKDDKRPEVRKIVMGFELRTSAQSFYKLSPEQHDELIAKLLGYMDSFGLDQMSFTLCGELAEAFERTTTPEKGAPLYERLAAELRKTGNPQLAQRIAKFEGSARRLKLPGNFMDISGTTTTGEALDWDSYRGKVVLVDFWATWCGPCRQQIPNMKAQLEKYGDKGFEVVGISLDNTPEECDAFVTQNELPWINLISPKESERGWDNSLANYYGISGIPAAFLLDKEGKVVSMNAIGPELNRLLEEVLGPVEDSAE